MKTKILEGLKAKFPGMSNSLLSGLAESKAKTATTEEEATTAVEGVTFQTVLDFQASTLTQTNIANYEKKHGLKDGKPVMAEEPDKKKEGAPDDEPAWAKTLREQNGTLQARLNAMDGEKVIRTRKTQLAAIMEKAPKTIKERYEKDLSRMSFKDDEEYTAWLGEVKTDTDFFVSELAARGGVYKPPMGNGGPKGDEKPSAEVEARIKARADETVPIAIQGLQTK